MIPLPPECRPRLAPGARLQFDQARDRWVLLAPERLLVPDDIALDILKRCDGERSLSGIVDDLASAYDADRSVVDADVQELLADLMAKRVLVT